MKLLSYIIGIFLATGAVAHAQTINQLPQFVSSTTPTNNITQQIYGRPLRLTGLTASATLCLDINNYVTSTGCPSSGGGSGGGTWSTTTSNVAGQLINYPNNTTDIVCIGGTATTTCKWFFDPNTNTFNATSLTGTSTFSNITITQRIKTSPVILGRPDGTYYVFPPASNTNTARGDAILAAQTAAQSGDTIYVGGITATTTSPLSKNGVNWFFYPGSVITSSGTSAVWWDNGSTVSFTVDGYGSFLTNNGYGIQFTGTNSSVKMHILKIETNGATSPAVYLDNGASLNLIAEEAIRSNLYDGIWNAGGTIDFWTPVLEGLGGSGSNAIEAGGVVTRGWANRIHSVSGPTINSPQSIQVTAGSIINDGGTDPVAVTGGFSTDANNFIRTFNMTGRFVLTQGKVTLLDSKISGVGSGKVAIGIGNGVTSGEVLTLVNVDATSGSGATKGIEDLTAGDHVPTVRVEGALRLSPLIIDSTIFVDGTGMFTDGVKSYFTGNIGIGTSSPYAQLSVVGASGIVAGKYNATSTTSTSTFTNVDVSQRLKLGEVMVTLFDGTKYMYRATTTTDIGRGNAVYDAVKFISTGNYASSTIETSPGTLDIGNRALPNFPSGTTFKGQGKTVTTLISRIDNVANVINSNLILNVTDMTILLPRHDVNNNIFGPQAGLTGTSTINITNVITYSDSDTFFPGTVASNGTTYNILNSIHYCSYDCWASNNNTNASGVANFVGSQLFSGSPYWPGGTGGARGINVSGNWTINILGGTTITIGTGSLNMSVGLQTSSASSTINCYSGSIVTDGTIGKDAVNQQGTINVYPGCTFDKSKTTGYIDRKQLNASDGQFESGVDLSAPTGLSVPDFGGGSSYTAGQVIRYGIYGTTVIGTTTSYSLASSSIAYTIGTTGDAPILQWTDNVNASRGALVCRSINGGAYNFYRTVVGGSINTDDGTTGWISGTCNPFPSATRNYVTINDLRTGFGIDLDNPIRVSTTTATSTNASGYQATYLSLTGTTATNTASNGFNLSAGCFAINGVCVSGSGAGGGVSLVTATWPVISSGGATPNITWGGISTSTNITVGQLPYWTGQNTLGTVATSTPTVTSPLTYSGTLGSFVGGSAGTFACATCLTANQTITLSGVVTGSGATSITTAFGTTNVANSVLANNTSGTAIPAFLATSSLYTFPWSIANGGTNATSFIPNTMIFYDGTRFVSTSSALTVNNLIASSTASSTFQGPITVGSSTPALLNSLLTLTGYQNNYIQMELMNRSAGNNASASYVATADIGTDQTYYGEFGINNSGYSQSSFASQNPLDVFLIANDQGLVIGTASSTNPLAQLRLITGGTASSSIRMVVNPNGTVGIGTTTPILSVLTVSSSTAPQFSLSAGAGINQWMLRNDNAGNLTFSTSTVPGNATTSIPALQLNSGASRGLVVGSSTASGAIIQGYAATASTTSLLLESISGGGCLTLKDVAGSGYTQLYAQAGVLYSKIATSLSVCN